MSFNKQDISAEIPQNDKNLRNSLTNEKEQPEDYESLKLRMKRKVTDFFNLNKFLIYEKFNEFMDYIDLSQIFSAEDLEVIWKTFTIISDGRESIELEEAIKGVNELLSYFYSDTNDLKAEEYNDNYDENQNLPSKENKNSDKYVLQNNYELEIDNKEINKNNENNINQSSKSNINNKTKAIDNIIGLNSSNKNINLNFDKLEINNQVMINRSRQNSVNLSSNQINNILNIQSGNNSAIKNNKPRHQRNITKIFKEIDIETLKQLRRVFSLLDIRNKEVLHIKELRDILKYKFINLTFDEIFDFLSNLSYDSDSNKFNNFESIQKKGKININFELYSRAISAIEQKILNENFEEFQETLNESYEVKETFTEVYENISLLDSESKDYISVLADIFISLKQKYETESSEINANLISLINKFDKNMKNNESQQKDPIVIFKDLSLNLEKIKIQITDYFKNFKDKYNDIEIFLKDLNKNNLQSCNKFALLKLISEKYERSIKSLEEDYKLLFEKYNTTQPLEVNEEIEKIMDENAYLIDELENRYNLIESLRGELQEKDESIFNVKVELEKLSKSTKDVEKNLNNYKRSYEEVQKDYEKLRNEIYEKILKEEEEAFSGKNSLNSKKDCNPNKLSVDLENEKKKFVQNSSFLKDKFLKEESENANKILEMSYEKLVLYCLDVEKANSKFTSLFNEKEAKIKSLEQEIEQLNNINQENSKKIYLLTNENARLNARMNDILRENEFNKGFRPSIALNNRISRVSNVRGISITPNESSNTLFEPNKKNNNFFAFNKDKINSILQNKTENKNKSNLNDNQDDKSRTSINNYNVSRKLQFETSEKNQFLSINNKPDNDNYVCNFKEKDSLFDVYAANKKIENNLNDKNEIRLSALEINDEEIENKNQNVNFIETENLLIEDKNNNLNNELIQQQREFIQSASNFQVKYDKTYDTRLTENYLNNEKRNSNLDYNNFDIDDNAGFIIQNTNDFNDKNQDKGSLEKQESPNLKEINNQKNNENNLDSNNIINYELNIPSTINSKHNLNNNTNMNDESSHFYNNTRRPTYMSNTQGIINELSRISSFNFDKDLPNQDEWETNDIINNGEEIYSTADHERKFVLDFSGKTNKEDPIQVNQIVDDIEDFEVNENKEDKSKENIYNTNEFIKIDSESNPFSYDSEKAIRDYLSTKETNHLSFNKNQFGIKSNTSNKDANLHNFNISNNKNSYNGDLTKNINSSLNSTKTDERASKKYSLLDNDTSKTKKIDYSKNTIKDISEKIPEEEDHEEDELEKKDKVQPIEKFSLGGPNRNSTKPTHNRNATMDLDKEFTKPSEYMCYDFLTLRRNVAIINMLDKYNEGVSSYEMFSENIHYFDDQKKKTKRYLFITCI